MKQNTDVERGSGLSEALAPNVDIDLEGTLKTLGENLKPVTHGFIVLTVTHKKGGEALGEHQGEYQIGVATGGCSACIVKALSVVILRHLSPEAQAELTSLLAQGRIQPVSRMVN